MLQEIILSRFIDITNFLNTDEYYIDYSILTETDDTVSMMFIKTKDPAKNKIFKNNKNCKICLPACLKHHIGEKAIIYNDYINSSLNEVFRIKPVNFKLENTVGIKYKYPYFTNTKLIIPFFYINKVLDDTAPILRMSFSLTNELTLKKDEIRAQFKIKKDGETFNYPLYKTTNGLKTPTLTELLYLIDENNKFLDKFSYAFTVDVTFNKYGVMIFKEGIQ